MRTKTLRYIDKLLREQPQQSVDPQTGAPINLPSIMPSKEFDDLDIAMKVIKTWAQKNDDKLQQNPAGAANLLAFFKICSALSAPPPMPPGAPGQPPQQNQPPAQA